MRKLIWFIGLFTLLVLTSCNNDNIIPSNTVTSSSTVTLDLTWSVSNSFDPTFDTDLDLLIVNSSNIIIERGTSNSSFESITLNRIPDGEYIVEIDHFDGFDATYRLVITDGFSNSNTIVGSVRQGDRGLPVAFLTISNNSYSLR